MRRVTLGGIRICQRCGRGAAELRTDDGAVLVIPLDPARARELAQGAPAGELRSLSDVTLEHLRATGLAPNEVVIDAVADQLAAFVSLGAVEEPEVVRCTPEEGVVLALGGKLRLYATEEALARAAARPGGLHGHRGSGGPDTVH
jgi:hypothetical protein